MQRIRELTKEFKKDNSKRKILDAIYELLKEKDRELFNHPKRKRMSYLISEEGKFSTEDSFLYEECKYKEVFFEDVIEFFLDFLSEEETDRADVILNILEYMYENKITSYAQDW